MANYGLQVLDTNGNMILDTSVSRLLKIIGSASLVRPSRQASSTLRIDIPKLKTSLDFWLAITDFVSLDSADRYDYKLTYVVSDGYVTITLAAGWFQNLYPTDTVHFLYGTY